MVFNCFVKVCLNELAIPACHAQLHIDDGLQVVKLLFILHQSFTHQLGIRDALTQAIIQLSQSFLCFLDFTRFYVLILHVVKLAIQLLELYLHLLNEVVINIGVYVAEQGLEQINTPLV